MRERVAALLEDVTARFLARTLAPSTRSACACCAATAIRWRASGPGFTRRFTHLRRRGSTRASSRRPTARSGSTKRSSCSTARRSRASATPRTPETPPRISTSSAVNQESETIAALFEEYEKALRNANALDFDDLLLEAVRLLQHDEATREAWNRRLSYVMIDEYQDTNRTPVRADAPAHRGSTATCAWWATRTSRSIAGAAPTSGTFWISSTIIPNAKTIRLEQNYRSTKNILAAAGAVVENNKARKGKKLWTESDAGRPARPVRRVTTRRTKRCSSPTPTEKYLAANPGDHVAVLYRTNSQSRQIEEALRRYGRKYNVVGGFSFYQRAEIKDTVAYLKLAASNTDSVSLMRVINTPARGIGRTTVEQIEHYAREHGLSLWDAIERIIDDQQLSTRSQSSLVIFRNLMQELSLVASSSPLPDLIRFILDRTGYRKMLQQEKTPESETRLENLDELINAAAEAAGARREHRAISWTMRRWWPMPMPTTSRRRSP